MKKTLQFLIALFITSTWSLTLNAAQFSGSTAFQVSGILQEDSSDQAIIYVKLDAIASSSGSWGVDGIKFKMNNTDNSMVRAAKLYLCPTAQLSLGNLLDSISNPGGDTLDFTFSLTNLGINSYYLFLTYDIDSNLLCNTFVFDASVIDSSLQISGLGGGYYTPVSPNPSGNRTLPNPTVTPSLTILPDSAITCLSDTVIFRATALFPGSNPQFKWYKNGALKETNSTGIFAINALDDGDVIFCKLMSSLTCASSNLVSSPNYVVSIPISAHIATIQANGMGTTGNLIEFTGSSNYGGSSPNYQWYKNSLPVGQDEPTFLDSTISSGDRVYFTVLSNSNCILTPTATSTEITVSFTDTIQSRTVALLDLGPENQETNGSNLFSAAHMLDVAGVSYKIVTDIYEAQNYKMVVGSSTVGNGVFSSNDHIALRNYVRNGGVLFFIRLKDPDLYPLFGVSGFDSKTTRHIMSWNMATNDDVLEWFDDPGEQSISLGDTAQPNVIETLGYTTNTATSLGQYDDGKASVTKNPYGNGFAYNFGISLKEIIFRNQVNKDYDAEREYTNAFEPTTDDLFLLTRAMYTKHVSKGVWKHTSPGNSQSTLIITHDIDALSSVNLMTAFANYEDSAQMGATYFMTAHYNDDIISAFYDSSIYDLNQIILKNRVIASHSVGHFVDMDDTTVVLGGQPGNTRSNYQPVNNGGSTQGATIWGELEVSKNILQSDCNTTVRSFRPGYLLVHPKQMQVMDSLGYDFSSSYTAPDLLTNFPFFIHEDKSFQSRLTNMLEIPIATSDVIRDYVLDSTNFPTLVTKWKNVYMSNHMNHAPTVLLIHPTRNYKLSAQRSLVNQLPNGVTIKSLEDYGDFWRNRNLVNFTSKLTGTSLLITISNSSFPLDSGFSLIVDDAQHLSQIAVKDESNNAIAFVEEIWGAHDKILYLKAENVIGLQEIFAGNNKRNGAVSLLVQPNPAVAEAVVDFTLDKALDVTIEVFSSNGVKISDLVKEPFLAGKHSRKLDCSKFAPGMYFLKLTTSAGIAVTKLMVQPK